MKNKIRNCTDRNFVIFDLGQGWNEHNRQGGKQKIHYRTTGTGNKIYCGRHKQSVNRRLPHKHHFHTRIHRKLYGLARKKNCQNRQAEIIKKMATNRLQKHQNNQNAGETRGWKPTETGWGEGSREKQRPSARTRTVPEDSRRGEGLALKDFQKTM